MRSSWKTSGSFITSVSFIQWQVSLQEREEKIQTKERRQPCEDGRWGAEVGAMLPQAKKHLELPEDGRGRILP